MNDETVHQLCKQAVAQVTDWVTCEHNAVSNFFAA